MLRHLKALRCWLRGSHAETCRIVILPGVKMNHHMHVCAECGFIIWDKLTSLDPELPDYRTMAGMGMSYEDQSRYMH